jgi:hypothetical protein
MQLKKSPLEKKAGNLLIGKFNSPNFFTKHERIYQRLSLNCPKGLPKSTLLNLS